MSEQSKQVKRLSVARALIVLVGLIGLLQLSFWSDQKSFEVEGPSRIVKGPQNTIYIQIDRKIAKVSQEGEVLQVLDLDADAAIPEPIADFFVEDDGRFLIARRDSQLLQYYSPEGKLIKTHSRIPSELVDGNHFCKFSKDAVTGIIYFADTSHHRIQIYGPDEKEISTITVPSGAFVAPRAVTEPADGEDDQGEIVTPDTPLRYPNGLLFEGDRLIAADTGNARLVVFYPNGLLDKVIPLFDGKSVAYNNPLKVARYGDNLYAIVRGPNFLGGEVAAFDLVSGQQRPFQYQKSLDPWDVFATAGEVLVADRESLSVLRYATAGEFLGVFGQPSLQNLYADRQIARKTYQWLRIGSLAGMIMLLLSLLFASRKQRIEHEAAGTRLHQPVQILQRLLGPIGSVRRNILLLIIPGIGQAAAGRLLRACTAFAFLLFFASLVVFSWIQYREIAAVQLPLHITVVLLFYTVWMAVALDGIRLSGRQPEMFRNLKLSRIALSLTAPLITVFTAVFAQFAREMAVRADPDLSLTIQMAFRSLMAIAGGATSQFSSTIPAAVVFGWSGAAAGMFFAIAWQAKLGKRRMVTGLIAGTFAGIGSWIVTAALLRNRLGWMFYIQPMQGALLGLLAYLYFRNTGMPVLVVLTAIAGAWIGDFIRMILDAVLGAPLRSLTFISADSYWPGVSARLGFIVLPVFFIHLAIWLAWNAAADRPVGSVDQPMSENRAVEA
ncbi:MAG: hypothetical protein OEW15_13305 [Nitrospirota bacterium]|nr:hypothetical protein [Nitrospirota bacterium]